MMFNEQDTLELKQSYEQALEEERKEYGDLPESELDGLRGIYSFFDLSADEVIINKLDEDMTPNQYFHWGTEPLRKHLVEHYLQQGATFQYNEYQQEELVIPQDATPFVIPSHTSTQYTKEQRSFVLDLLYLFLSQNQISKQELLQRLGIAS